MQWAHSRDQLLSCRQIVNTKIFKEVGASFVDVGAPECKDFAEGYREYWACKDKDMVSITLSILLTNPHFSHFSFSLPFPFISM